jgi:hypothetical protein
MLTLVIQPRLGRKLRVQAWSRDEVTAFTGFLRNAATATDAPDAPRVANDYCWFCRARVDCPEIIALETRKATAELAAAMTRIPATIPAFKS